MKKIVPWLERKIKGKGINHNKKQNLVKGVRGKIFPESSSFVAMNSSTVP